MRTDLNARRTGSPIRLVALFMVAGPMLAGCGGMTDLSLKDQEWFARPGQIFKAGNSKIETPPLSVTKEVTPNDLISSEGACPGMPEPAAAADAVAGAPVALGHTECDVARAVGIAPDNVNLSSNERGERVALVTWTHGPRPGAYTFTSGRLTAIERVDVPAPAKPARPAKKKRT